MVSVAFVLLASVLPNASSEFAILSIQAQPGVEVIWEGISIGSTDESGALVVEQVPPGRYGLELRKGGFRQKRVEVELAAGERISFKLDLEPQAPPSKPVSPPPASSAPSARLATVEPSPESRLPRGAAEESPAREASQPTVKQGSEPNQEEAAGAAAPEVGDAVGSPRRSPLPETPAEPASEGEVQRAAKVVEPELGPVTGSSSGRGAAEDRRQAEGTSGSNGSFLIAALVVLALALGVGLYFVGHYRADTFFAEWDLFSSELSTEVERALTPPPRGPEPWERSAREAKTVASEAGEQAFIQELRRQEEEMGRPSRHRPRRPQPEIIDAEFEEIIDVEADA